MDQYLKFMDQVKRLNKRLDLSYYEVELLNIASRAHFSGQPIVVGDLIRQKGVASQATLHVVFKGLISKKLLLTKPHEIDDRIKRVDLTKLALDHYKRLHIEMSKLAAK